MCVCHSPCTLWRASVPAPVHCGERLSQPLYPVETLLAGAPTGFLSTAKSVNPTHWLTSVKAISDQIFISSEALLEYCNK